MKHSILIKSVGLFTLCASLLGCHSTKSSTQPLSDTSQVVSVKKIWDGGGHNAFTDLIRFNGEWFCTFRESEGHVAGDGKIRVLTSHDGDKWISASLLTEDGVDLRDPKLSITPKKQLMLVLGGTIHEGSKVTGRQPRVAFSQDGHTWTTPQRVLTNNDWLWRVTWKDGRAYGIVYTVPGRKEATTKADEWTARLVESSDGIHFRDVTELNIPDRPNEATIRFNKNGDAIALIRREAGNKEAWIGTSTVPYRGWKWKTAGMFVGGPNFIILPDNSMIAGGRQMHPAPTGARTFVGRMDLQSVTPEITLPSGGDCSYPGLVWHEGYLWVSYYSSHEGRTSIYLAKIKP